MNLDGKEVTHVTFGEGTIVAIRNNKMKVAFPKAVKTFIFPDSFDKFFVISDKNAKGYVEEQLEKRRKQKKIRAKERKKELELAACIRSLKIKPNAHGVFGMKDNDANTVFDTWQMFTGNYASGKRKGQPRIPKNLKMNSACLLTTKLEGTKEAERIVIGLCMVPEGFAGEDCADGMVPAHEHYRIVWGPEEEELYFWNYFPRDARRKQWGVSEMKYLQYTVVLRVLQDMMEMASDPEKKKEAEDFYDYFCELNQLS